MNFLRRERYRDSIESFKRSIALDNNPDALRRLGSAYYRLDQFKDAIKTWKKAAELDSSSAEYCEIISKAYQQLGEIEKATRWCQKALEIDANYLSANRRLEDLNTVQKYTSKARKNPDQLMDQVNLLRVFRIMGMKLSTKKQKLIVDRMLYAEEKRIHGVLYETPGSASANHDLGRNLQMQDRHQEAITYLERSCELAIWNTDYYIDLANAYQQTGELDQAIAVCQKAMEFDDVNNVIAKCCEKFKVEKQKLATTKNSKAN